MSPPDRDAAQRRLRRIAAGAPGPERAGDSPIVGHATWDEVGTVSSGEPAEGISIQAFLAAAHARDGAASSKATPQPDEHANPLATANESDDRATPSVVTARNDARTPPPAAAAEADACATPLATTARLLARTPPPAATAQPDERAAAGGIGGWVPGAALRAAAAQYSWEHPADDWPTDDDPPPGGVRRAADGPRVRWAIPWRVAGTAALVVALVAGAAVLRSVALTPGAAVELPEPAPMGSAVTAEEEPAPIGSAAPAESGDQPTAGVVVVHVVGAVATPGVVRLPSGARVEDAVAAAGGASPDADLGRLNLARVLIDGEQVVVPRPGDVVPPGTGGGATGGGEGAGGAAGEAPVDLNTASLAQLDALPGVGPVLAQRILDRRPFTSVDELDEVSGIGPTALERLRPLVRV